MFSISKKKKRKGFTLTELMVVIVVISITTGVTWINFRQSGRVFAVERSISQMAQEVRASLEMTMAMRDYVIPPGCVGTNRIVAYGINFRTAQPLLYRRMVYIIDGDSLGPNFGTIVCSVERNTVNPVEISTVNLEEGAISSIIVFSGATPTPVSELNVIFAPPHPRTYIENTNRIDFHTIDGRQRLRSRHDRGEISVSLDGSHMGIVRVNRAGLIEIIRPGQ